MSGHAQLTYADLDKAYAFARGSEDEFVEVAADHPMYYRTVTASGIRRAPLPALSDREPCSFDDVEDALIARLDGETVEEDEDVSCEPECDDLDFEFGTSERDDQEYFQAWQDHVDDVADAIASKGRIPCAPVAQVLHIRLAARRHAQIDVAPVDDEDDRPAAISGLRAVMSDGSIVMRKGNNGTGGYTCWKDTTKSPTQFMRHAGRVQPTFRRGGRTAA